MPRIQQTAARKKRPTSLGVPLEFSSRGEWRLDLSRLRLFTGLSVIARLLGDDILDRLRQGTGDIFVERRVIPEITPELKLLGVDAISVFARRSVLIDLPAFFLDFQGFLRTVFGTLQRPRWGELLFPEVFKEIYDKDGEVQTPKKQEKKIKKTSKNIQALLFPFARPSLPDTFYFLLERSPKDRLLRITIESQGDSRLRLDAIPHRRVDDLDKRSYLQGLTRISETFYQGILRECENNGSEYHDNKRRHSHFFLQMPQIGLPDCESLILRWPFEESGLFLQTPSKEIVRHLKRFFIALEDHTVIERLRQGDLVRIQSKGFSAWLDLSQQGRCLNVSLLEKRKESRLDSYLERMPTLKKVAQKNRKVFQNTRIFLIHHITGEILATIEALREMGCDFLHVLFVKYAGLVPGSYLEALLSLPEDRFFFAGLNRIDTKTKIDGYYLLSRLYSDISQLRELDDLLKEKKLPYFSAMQMSAGHLFFREALLARKHGQRLLLIEDGGYLAPLLNQLCLEKTSLEQALIYFGLSKNIIEKNLNISLQKSELRAPLFSFLEKLLAHTVEHTRNGFNRLEEVEKNHQALAFPAATIAISDTKRNRESEEVSISILHAIESILHGQGKVFSERKALVLGSRGAIGRNLMEDLSAKLTARKVLGVDKAVSSPKERDKTNKLENLLNQPAPDTNPGVSFPSQNKEYSSFAKIPPEALAGTDVLIGVTGISLIKKKELERLIRQSGKQQFWFASGSTKTAEFADLSRVLESLQASKNPRLCGLPVEITRDYLHDPQTRHLVADIVRIRFSPMKSNTKNNRKKDNGAEPTKKPDPLRGKQVELFLLGGLTPINFLFYGVPTETMDAILAQLLEVSAGMYSKIQKGVSFPKCLLAVDRDISADAEMIQ